MVYYSQTGTQVHCYGEIHPKQQVVHTGQPFQIFCNSVATPGWYYSGLLYGFMKKDHIVDLRYRRNGSRVISVNYASPYSNYGEYKCFGDYLNGKLFFNSSVVYVGGK